MNFKLKSMTIALATVAIFGMTACDNEEEEPTPNKPIISNVELGHDDDKIGHIGEDLHIDAKVDAEGKIDKIKVEIHSEDGTGEDIEVEFTQFAGLKNTEFHEHVEIPATATPGEYHFHLEVIDQEGQTAEYEADIMLENE